MLVTFSCTAYADITMFGDVAVRLLKLMGHSGTVPGAILAEDVHGALEQLLAAIHAEQKMLELEKPEDEGDNEPLVSFLHRALPLIELLEASENAKCNVMWDK